MKTGVFYKMNIAVDKFNIFLSKQLIKTNLSKNRNLYLSVGFGIGDFWCEL